MSEKAQGWHTRTHRVTQATTISRPRVKKIVFVSSDRFVTWPYDVAVQSQANVSQHAYVCHLVNNWNIYDTALPIWLLTILRTIALTNWGRVTHICFGNLCHHWFKSWLVTWSAPSHCRNQCWNIVNSNHRYKPQWNLKENSYNIRTIDFIQENKSGNIC